MLPRCAIFALAILSAAPAAAYDRLPVGLARLSPADFLREVQVEGDPRQGAVTVSTRAGYQRTRMLKGALADDVHLRAVVDRAAGKVTWQVWHDLAYVGARKEVESVHYFIAGGSREVRPFLVEYRPDRCPPTDTPGFCGEAVKIGFELTEAEVREIAAAYAPSSRAPWGLRFKVAGGQDVMGGLAPAEASAILAAVDRLSADALSADA